MNLGPLSLLVLQATSFCNIDCKYCYLPHRDSKKVLSPEMLSLALRRASESGLLGPTLDILWHAGEPLVVGIDFYRDASKKIAETDWGATKIRQHLQTNATLLNDAWCEFFKNENFSVGVSLDGPQPLHDRYRVTRAGKGSFAKTMQGIDMLRKRGVSFSALAVITQDSLDHSRAVLDFFESEEIRDIGFNVEELDSYRPAASFRSRQEAEAGFRAFMLDALDRHRSGRLRIREIEDIQTRLEAGRELKLIHAVPMRFVTVDVDGGFSTFCPQLHDAKYRDGTRHVFGNIVHNDFLDVVADPKFVEVYGEIMEGVRLCAETCKRFGLCGSNQVGVKLFENGTYASTETLICKTRVIIVADILEEFPLARVEATSAEHSA